MPESPLPPRAGKPLLDFRGVTIDVGGAETGPLNFPLQRGDRVWFDCPSQAHYDGLVEVVSGRRRVTGGYIEELGTIVVQSDTYLRASLDLNRTLEEFYQSPDAPEFVWLEGRRRSLRVLVDKLGLAPHHGRLPLKMQPEEVVLRYWALRFLLSRADLLIGREIFSLPQPEIRAALAARWGEFPGTILAACPEADLPGPVSARHRLTQG